MVEYKYNLVVSAGNYYANSIPGLLWAVFTHRVWHLSQGHGWID